MFRKNCMFALIAAVGLLAPSGLLAQPLTMYHHLSFTEVDAVTGLPIANPNGILEPGEGARIALSISFDPSVGTVLVDPPNLAGFRIHAAHRTQIDLLSSGETSGAWMHLAVSPGWDAWMGDPPHGFPTSNGRIVEHILPQQHAIGADTRNPVPEVWSGIWIPHSYSSREIRFNTVPRGINGVVTASTLWLENPAAPGEFLNYFARTEISQMFLPIIPAPSGGTTLALAGILALRRRR
jgi:hypothetical protein